MRRFKANLEIATLGAIIGGTSGSLSGILFFFDMPLSHITLIGYSVGAISGAISGFLLCFGMSSLFLLLMRGRSWEWGYLYGTVLGGVAGAASSFLTLFALTRYHEFYFHTQATPIQYIIWSITPGVMIGVITAIILMSVYRADLE